MIHLEGINKTYFNGAPLHVLKGIDLDIEKGEMVRSEEHTSELQSPC